MDLWFNGHEVLCVDASSLLLIHLSPTTTSMTSPLSRLFSQFRLLLSIKLKREFFLCAIKVDFYYYTGEWVSAVGGRNLENG